MTTPAGASQPTLLLIDGHSVAYRAFFATHFPDAPIGPDGTPPHLNLTFQRRMLVKHLLASGKMAAYLGRFESDMTVLDNRRGGG